jgi:cytidine deaminase
MGCVTESQIKELLLRANEVRKNAYAPYSRFHVGASVLTSSGKVYQGCNVENASYGLCICAERNAIAAAVAAGERDFVALAVVGGDGEKPVTPCGACRQVMVEFAPELIVAMAGGAGIEKPLVKTAAELLPHYFIFEKEQ